MKIQKIVTLYSFSLIFKVQSIDEQRSYNNFQRFIVKRRLRSSIFNDSVMKKNFQCFEILWQFIAFSRRKMSLLCHPLPNPRNILEQSERRILKVSSFNFNPNLLLHDFFLQNYNNSNIKNLISDVIVCRFCSYIVVRKVKLTLSIFSKNIILLYQ